MKNKELTLCGLAAVKAQFAKDASAIKRLYFDYETGRKIGVICKALAQARKVYRCVEPGELEKIAQTVHHGGVVAVVAAPEWRSPTPDDLRDWSRRGEPLLVLDRIGNAHNLGAIARTAAFFGVPRLIVAHDPAAAMPGEAAHRVAEGGLAHVEVWRASDMAELVRQAVASGYEVVGAATRGGRPEVKDVKKRAVALVLGNEEHGISPAVAKACSRLVTIPGSGKVESLNVSVAAGILMWELLFRR